MARVEFSAGVEGWIGKVGNGVYRRHGDEILITKVPDFDDHDPTPDQRKTINRFINANAYAAHVTKHPERRAHYEAAAAASGDRIRDLAHRDAMRPPVLEAIDVSGYAGSPDQVIRVTATDDTEVVEVRVEILRDGRRVEYGSAELEIGGLWAYVARTEIPKGTTVRIVATAWDRPGGWARGEMDIVVPERPVDTRAVQICIPNANLHTRGKRERTERPVGPVRRSLESELRKAAAQFPIIVVTGPRSAGATTLVKKLFRKTHHEVSLERPDVRALAVADPIGFLKRYAPPVVIDQIQLAPGLLPHIAEGIERIRPGRYILTTSTGGDLTACIAELFGSQVAVRHLLPLSFREAAGQHNAPLPWEKKSPTRKNGPTFGDLWEAFIRGSYPELAANPSRDAYRWHADYVQAYLERDVRLQRRMADIRRFEVFLRALAIRSGRVLHLSEMAAELGVAVNTVKAWIEVLEATGQVVVLSAFSQGTGRRLVKAPKVYFTDAGTVCYLTGVRDPQHAASGPMSGPIAETAVLSEIRKAYLHRGMEPKVSFWRTSRGVEVDFIVETADGFVPIDVTSTATPWPGMSAGVDVFRGDVGERALPGYVVHMGDLRAELRPGVTALPFGQL